MKSIENLFAKAVEELERMLSSKTVVGDPIAAGDRTLIPLVSVGFGFGVASSDPDAKGAGGGGGTGGGGGVKPVALVVIGDGDVRVDPVMSGGASVMGKAVDAIDAAVQKRMQTGSDPSQ